MKVAIVAVVPDDWGRPQSLAGLHEDAYNALCGALEDIGGGVTVDSIEAPAPVPEVLELISGTVVRPPSQYDVRRDALHAACLLQLPMGYADVDGTDPHGIGPFTEAALRRTAERTAMFATAAAEVFEQHLTRDDGGPVEAAVVGDA